MTKKMTTRIRASAVLAMIWASSAATPCLAWGPDGHHTVGAIADRLIAGTPALATVKELLGDITLEQAAVWADCAKGIDPAKDFAYTSAGRYPECKIFENPDSELEMADFVRRNTDNCSPKPGEEYCHKQYHYSDIAVQHDRYDRSFTGARDDDVVAALGATIEVLRDRSAPAPFNIKNKREALLLLAHYVGDVHQPLHVGAVYLDKNGAPVNPDSGAFDPLTETHGGNSIHVSGGSQNLHATWDSVPAALKPSRITSAMITRARAVVAPTSSPEQWAAEWATETQRAAQKAFSGLTFTATATRQWDVVLPASYSKTMTTAKTTQIVRAGARLAQVLQMVAQASSDTGVDEEKDARATVEQLAALGKEATSSEAVKSAICDQWDCGKRCCRKIFGVTLCEPTCRSICDSHNLACHPSMCAAVRAADPEYDMLKSQWQIAQQKGAFCNQAGCLGIAEGGDHAAQFICAAVGGAYCDVGRRAAAEENKCFCGELNYGSGCPQPPSGGGTVGSDCKGTCARCSCGPHAVCHSECVNGRCQCLHD